MFSWIGIIFTVIRYLPTAISIIREISKIIKSMKGEDKRKAQMTFKKSLQDTKKTRDLAHLNQCLRDMRKHRKC